MISCRRQRPQTPTHLAALNRSGSISSRGAFVSKGCVLLVGLSSVLDIVQCPHRGVSISVETELSGYQNG